MIRDVHVVTDIVQKSRNLEDHTRLAVQFMERLHLIEDLQSQPGDNHSMLLVVKNTSCPSRRR
jgi:hypothetical protein